MDVDDDESILLPRGLCNVAERLSRCKYVGIINTYGLTGKSSGVKSSGVYAEVCLSMGVKQTRVIKFRGWTVPKPDSAKLSMEKARLGSEFQVTTRPTRRTSMELMGDYRSSYPT